MCASTDQSQSTRTAAVEPQPQPMFLLFLTAIFCRLALFPCPAVRAMHISRGEEKKKKKSRPRKKKNGQKTRCVSCDCYCRGSADFVNYDTAGLNTTSTGRLAALRTAEGVGGGGGRDCIPGPKARAHVVWKMGFRYAVSGSRSPTE